MRNRIFIFEQQVALRLGLKLNELLLLDYLYNFMQSGYMRSKEIGDKCFYKISYNKIAEDLPILYIKERQIRYMLNNLEEKKIIERFNDEKNQLYVYIDFDVVFGNKLPANSLEPAINFRQAGNGLLVIDYYDIKKIKINCESAHAIKTTHEEFMELFKENIALITTELFYETLIKDKLTLDEIGEDYFIFSVSNINAVAIFNGEKIKSAFDRTISQVLLKQTY